MIDYFMSLNAQSFCMCTALQKVILCPLLTMLDSFWRNISPRLLIFLTILVFVSFRLGLLFDKSATNHQGKTSLPKGSTISGGTFLTRAKMSDAIFWRNFMCIKEKKERRTKAFKKDRYDLGGNSWSKNMKKWVVVPKDI